MIRIKLSQGMYECTAVMSKPRLVMISSFRVETDVHGAKIGNAGDGHKSHKSQLSQIGQIGQIDLYAYRPL